MCEALGKGLLSLIISLIRYIVVIIPASVIFSKMWEANGVYVAFVFTEFTAALISASIKCNFSDVEFLSQLFNEFFNVAVVNNISLCGLQVSLSFPHIIRHMVTLYTQVKCALGYPGVGQNDVLIFVIKRREYKYKCRNIRCT